MAQCQCVSAVAIICDTLTLVDSYDSCQFNHMQCDDVITRSTSQWRHNERGGVSNHRRLDWVPFVQAQIKEVTGLCEGNSTLTDEFPAQRASDAENVSNGKPHSSAVNSKSDSYFVVVIVVMYVMSWYTYILDRIIMASDCISIAIPLIFQPPPLQCE